MENYCKYLENLGRSRNTIRVYSSSINHFFEKYPLLTQENAIDYRNYLITNFNCKTVNLRIAALNSYIKFMNAPIEPLRSIRLTNSSFAENVVSNEELTDLKNHMLQADNITMYLLMRFMAATGMRISEALQVEKQDVVAGYKDIVSKANRARRVFFPAALCKETLAMIPDRNGPIFLNAHGKVISASGVRYWFQQYATELNIDKTHAHPHAFRHRFALNFLEKSSDLALLADLLGHESIETTRIYLKRTYEEQKAYVNEIVDW